MQKKNGKTDDTEIIMLLRTLRIEATREMNFEERFMYDFRERLVREAACRPARVLLWEHLLQMLGNVGRRRFLMWGGATASLLLCVGVLGFESMRSYGRPVINPVPLADVVAMETAETEAERPVVRRSARKSRLAAAPSRRATSIVLPNLVSEMSAEDVAHTIVTRREARKSYTESLMRVQGDETSTERIGLLDDRDQQNLYSSQGNGSFAEHETITPGASLPVRL